MAKTRLFGESISPGVVQQLKKRAEVLSKGVRQSNELRYLNEKTSWVRMISGVDTFDKDTKKYTSQEAKNFILSGGEVKWDGKAFVQRQGFKTGPTEDGVQGRYNYDKDLGIRPEAGITSFSIKHIGTYGTLREANLDFNVWTRKDLEKAQNLFLRPGMSLIVEWGNSIYLDENGNVKDTLNLPNPEDYFKEATSTYIADLLNKGKEDNSYNYDAFLGYITNFTWSFRPDGGYDCSVKAVTKGAVLESLSVYRSTGQVLAEVGGIPPQELNNINIDEQKTYLHYVTDLLKSYAETFVTPGAPPADQTAEQNKIETYKNEIQQNIINLLKDQGIVSNTTNTFKTVLFYNLRNTHSKNNESVTYISLNTFCALLNIAFGFRTPSGDSLTSFYVAKENEDFLLPKYCTSKSHFSLNPFYCILPKTATVDLKNPPEKVEVSLGTLQEDINIREEKNTNNVSSIYINLVEVLKDLDSIYEGQKDLNNANVFDFVKTVLNKLNSYLGNINSFDFTFDEDLQKWIIIDRNCILPPAEEGEENFKIEKINPTGLQSIISDLSLQTKITPALTSQIAISAAASGRPTSSEVNIPLLKWNSNTVDRFSLPEFKQEKKQIDPVTGLTQEQADQQAADLRQSAQPQDYREKEANQILAKEVAEFLRTDFLENVKKLYLPLGKIGFVQQKRIKTDQGVQIGIFYSTTEQVDSIEEKLFEQFKSEAFARFNTAINGSSQTTTTVVNTGLIPIELQLTLDGISGIKIGQIFELGNLENRSNILPEVYDSYGFIVTGVNSTIQNNKWFTTITGLTFKTEKDVKPATGTIS